MWIKTSLIALEFAAATLAASPAPTLAQGVHVAPMALALTLAGRVIVTAITEGASMTIMPMTAGTEVAAEP